MRILLLSVGLVSTALGLIGIVMPLLPTTPFLLLAAVCFARSSDSFHRWLVQTQIYETYVSQFLEKKGFTLKEKLKLLLSLYIVMGFSIWMVGHFYIRMGLIMMVVLQTLILLIFVKTLPGESKSSK